MAWDLLLQSIGRKAKIGLPLSIPIYLVPVLVLVLPIFLMHLHKTLEVVPDLLLHLPLLDIVALSANVLRQWSFRELNAFFSASSWALGPWDIIAPALPVTKDPKFIIKPSR